MCGMGRGGRIEGLQFDACHRGAQSLTDYSRFDKYALSLRGRGPPDFGQVLMDHS